MNRKLRSGSAPEPSSSQKSAEQLKGRGSGLHALSKCLQGLDARTGQGCARGGLERHREPIPFPSGCPSYTVPPTYYVPPPTQHQRGLNLGRSCLLKSSPFKAAQPSPRRTCSPKAFLYICLHIFTANRCFQRSPFSSPN